MMAWSVYAAIHPCSRPLLTTTDGARGGSQRVGSAEHGTALLDDVLALLRGGGSELVSF